MTLPLHILRRFVMPGGVRLTSTEPPREVGGICAICAKSVFYIKINGATQLDGLYSGGLPYHYACKPKSSLCMLPAKQELPLYGNLEPEEYRFWIGYRETKSAYAMCRCCRTSVYGTKMRKEHFQKQEHFVGGKNCAARLADVYSRMLKMAFCCVCHKQRFEHTKWGIPICDSIACQNTWRFDSQIYTPMKMWLELQEKKAEHPEISKVVEQYGDAIIDTNVMQTGKDGKTTYRPWCKVCLMLADTAEHDEEHMRRMLGGGLGDN